MRYLILTITLLAAVMVAAQEHSGSAPPPEPDPMQPAPFTAQQRGLMGSAHDFTDPVTGEGDACSACHIPHRQTIRPVRLTITTRPAAATQPSDGGAVTTRPAVDAFRIEGQRQVFVPGRYTPGPTSLICLGCHDGTVATSTIGSSHALLAGVREGFAMPDGFVWRDHPIGVAYPIDPREYKPAAFVVKQGLPLPQGRIECISCHDPHHTTGLPDMLQVSNDRSNLCLTCHLK